MKKGKDKIPVVFVGRYNESEVLSGPEKTAKRIFEQRTKEEKSVFIQYFFDGRKYGIIKKLFGKQTQNIGSNAVLYTLGLLRIVPMLLSLRPKLIHIITFERFALICFLYKMFSRVRIVFNCHGVVEFENVEVKNQPFFYRLKDRICERKFLRSSDSVIFPSESARELAMKYFRVTSDNMIIPNGIDEVFHKVFCSRKQPDNLFPKAVVMNLTEYSASGINVLNTLLEFISESLEIVIIGNKAELHNPRSVHKIEYAGIMDAAGLAEFYTDKDFYLGLNRYETFSIAAAEAMAAGLVPVLNVTSGISEYIKEKECGVCVSEDRIEADADDFDKLIRSDDLRSDLSARSASIYETLNWSEIYKVYLNIYGAYTA